MQLEQWCKVQLQRNKVQGAIVAIVQGAIAMKQGAKCNWSKLEIASGKLQEYKEDNTADYHQFRYFWNS